MPTGDPVGPRPAPAVRVAVRAVQRPYRVARQPGRGRAARGAGQLPELPARETAAALRRSGIRLPRVRRGARGRAQRQADPDPGRRRTVRRPLRGPAGAHPTPRPAPWRPGTRGRVVLPGRGRDPAQQYPHRLADPALDRGRPVDRRADQQPRPGGAAVGAGRQRDVACGRGGPAGGGRPGGSVHRRGRAVQGPRGRPGALDPNVPVAGRFGDGPRTTHPRGVRHEGRGGGRPGPGHHQHPPRTR